MSPFFLGGGCINDDTTLMVNELVTIVSNSVTNKEGVKNMLYAVTIRHIIKKKGTWFYFDFFNF